MSLLGWIICCGAPADSSSARPFMVFSRVPPLLCAFGSCTLNRTSWTTWDHLQETRQFAVGCPSPEVYPVLCRFGMRHRGPGSVYFIVQRGDVRFYVVIGAIGVRETYLLLCRCCDCLFIWQMFKYEIGKVSRKRTAVRRNARCDCSCSSKTD